MIEPNNLNKNYIFDNFKLPDTNVMVFLNGIYEKNLSDSPPSSIFENKTLKITKNTKHKIPLHLLFLSSKNHHNTFNIIAEENSSISIIEEHANLQPLCTSEIEINIITQANSEITHQKFQFENTDNQINTTIKQEKNSKFKSTLISKGGKLSKDAAHIKLSGEKAHYDNKSISLLNDNQNMTNQIRIEHLKPSCTSNVLAKSIINDNATNNFDCRVIAHPSAIKTKTHVTNKNLLLSDKATANTAPELEIYADDIICTHGATVGQLDEDAIFYLRSRGITKENAKKILMSAFIKEIIEQTLKYDRFKTAMDLNYG